MPSAPIVRPPPPDRDRGPSVAIIGAGFAGLGMAIQLRRAGFHRFTIYEQADGVGGTWRDNTYPGASCDIPSYLYSFSFETKTDWSRAYADQAEILAYLEECARRHALSPHVRFRTGITGARFDAASAQWVLQTSTGEPARADVLVSGTGQLSRPRYPDVPGRETFAGVAFHSARWNHAHDLTGRHVAVIGNAASAIQFIPRIAPRVATLTVFQRSAEWILPRGDRGYSAFEKRLFGRIPWLTRLYRYGNWVTHEARWPLFTRGNRLARLAEWKALRFMRRQILDPALQRALTPDYPIGCKRILVSDEYYASLTRPNVELVTSPLVRFVPAGPVTADGRIHGVDTVIYATGFDATGMLAPMEVTGVNGVRLAEAWRDGAAAWLGLMVSGFPNLFLLYGPSTNLGHNSIILMLEAQVQFVLRQVRALAEGRARAIEVPRAVQDRYREEVERRLRRLVWSADCGSWYRDPSGRITTNWPWSTVAYWWRTRRHPGFA